jgi:hypothetical protein
MNRGVGLLTHTSVGAPAFANITIRGRGKEEEWRKHREERKEALEVASATNANMAGA